MTKFSQLKFASLSVMLLLLLAGCNLIETPLVETPIQAPGRPDGTLEIVVTVLDTDNKPLEGMVLELIEMPLEREVSASAETNVRGVAKLSKDVYIANVMQPIHLRVRDAKASGRDYMYRPWYGTIQLSKADFVRKKARKELVVHLERMGVSYASGSLEPDVR